MEFSVSDEAPWPRQRVFETHRDGFAVIAPRMDEVDRVALRSRAVGADGVVIQVHEWVGNPAALPRLLRPFVSPQMLRWEDEARWDPHAFTCTWQVHVPALGPVAEIRGQHRYIETPGGCRIALDGRFDLHPEQWRGLTLPPGAAPWIERFVVSLIVPLVRRSGQVVIEHLAD